MKTGGVECTVGTWTSGLYYDQPKPTVEPKGFGLRIALKWGPVVWPCPKFWSKTWNHDHYPDDANIWFMIRLPFAVGPFVSLVLGRVAMYIGFKDNGPSLLPSMKFETNRHNFNP